LHREYVRKYREANIDQLRAKGRDYTRTLRAADPEKAREAVRKSYAKHAERYREVNRQWHKDNAGAIRALNAARKAMQRVQRCACCSNEQIAEHYKQAALCGRFAHVDHIVQLSLGGPHCARNLVALTAGDHIAKTKLDAGERAFSHRRNKLLRTWAHAAPAPAFPRVPIIASTAPLLRICGGRFSSRAA
jgi:5-methylcytosine-specific restriction endonuclease McrA